MARQNEATATGPVGQDITPGVSSFQGGQSQTVFLQPGNPAACDNQDSNAGGLPPDQHSTGIPRGCSGGGDIGEFEVKATLPIVGLVIYRETMQWSRFHCPDVLFDSQVIISVSPLGALTKTWQSDGDATALNTTVTHVTATSVGYPIFDMLTEAGSLLGGRYIWAAGISSVSPRLGQLVGNGGGSIGDIYVLMGSPANNLFGHYADADGSGQATSGDFLTFRLAFPSSSTAFDFIGSRTVDSGDVLQFRLRGSRSRCSFVTPVLRNLTGAAQVRIFRINGRTSGKLSCSGSCERSSDHVNRPSDSWGEQ